MECESFCEFGVDEHDDTDTAAFNRQLKTHYFNLAFNV